MNKHYKQCKGCLSLIQETCMQQYEIYKTCPCQKCLIKGICIKACDEYSDIDHEAYIKKSVSL